jgi:ArsR family transcriptional regulator
MFVMVLVVTLDALSSDESASPNESASNAACCPPLIQPSLSEDEAAELAAKLKALADPVRVRLLNIIANAGEACACEFPDLLGKSQPTISHHLSVLAKAGVIEREQRGKWAWFWINKDQRADICRAWALPEDSS